MAKPAIIGPKNEDVENPIANMLKLRVRDAGSPILPVALLMATWNTMKPVPMSAVAKYSATSVGQKYGSMQPADTDAAANISALRTPMRSVSRPALTASSIGSAAYSDIRLPMATVGVLR